MIFSSRKTVLFFLLPVVCMGWSVSAARRNNILRGGSSATTKHHKKSFALFASTTTEDNSALISVNNKTNKRPVRLAATIAATTLVTAFAYSRRAAWAPYLLDKTFLQEQILSVLSNINKDDYFGLSLYVLAMAFWELLGLSTIPVETAAGMAFGFKRGVIANFVGKLLGAATAFGLGRTLLSKWVREKTQHNKVLSVINVSVEKSPFRDTFLLKQSCFPEFIKNFGASIFPSISWIMFVTATIVHGGFYSILWTMLGHDTAMRMGNSAVSSNPILQVLLTTGTIVGFVVSPLLMAWWIKHAKGLKEKEEETLSLSLVASTNNTTDAIVGPVVKATTQKPSRKVPST